MNHYVMGNAQCDEMVMLSQGLVLSRQVEVSQENVYGLVSVFCLPKNLLTGCYFEEIKFPRGNIIKASAT